MTTRLAVLGSPIGHSKSPLLHAAAYAALGLDWEFEAIEVTGDSLRDFIHTRDESWRGLSLTMPLKRDVLPFLTSADALVTQTGGANTVLFDDGLHGFNTDVYGIVEAFHSNGVHSLNRVQIIGGGATAASALSAVASLGATTVTFALRDPAKAGLLEQLAATLGVEVVVRRIGVQDRSPIVPDAVISTLPGHSEHGLVFPEAVRAGAVLFDVAYAPWPSSFATAWLEVGGHVISGLDMLTLQALAQVRVFVNGSPDAALDHELAVLAAMQRAVAP